MANGEYSKAESIFKEIIGNDIDKDDSLLREKFNLSVCLNKHGRFAEAEPLLRQLLPLNDDVATNDLPTTFALQKIGIVRLISEALERQGKHEEAKATARKGYAVAKSMDDEGRSDKLVELREFYHQLSPTLLEN